jgi:hypothetical protein
MSWEKQERHRRSAAAQFFAIHQGESAESLERLLGGQVSKATIRRDQTDLKSGKAPSEKSARAYAMALNRVEPLDANNPADLQEFIRKAIERKVDFHADIPLADVMSNEVIEVFPPFWNRLMKRIDSEKWESVEDILAENLSAEGLRKAKKEGWSELVPYLRQNLGLAYLRQGFTDQALNEFRAGYRLVKDTNHKKVVRYKLAVDMCFALIDSGPSDKSDVEMREALGRIIGDPPPSAELLVNVMILLQHLIGDWTGFFTGSLVRHIDNPSLELDAARVVDIIMSDPELKFAHGDDMYRVILDALQRRLGRGSKEMAQPDEGEPSS